MIKVMNLNLIRNYLPSLDNVYYSSILSHYELCALRRAVDFYKQIYAFKTSDSIVGFPVGSNYSFRDLLLCLGSRLDIVYQCTFRFIFVINLVEHLFNSEYVFLTRYHNADYDSWPTRLLKYFHLGYALPFHIHPDYVDLVTKRLNLISGSIYHIHDDVFVISFHRTKFFKHFHSIINTLPF